MEKGLNRYVICHSDSGDGVIVAYANSMEEAKEKFSSGNYVLEPMIMKSFRAYDIEWDTDGEEVSSLPDNVIMDLGFIEEPAYNDIVDTICDYLSDKFGYCVFNFLWEETK